MEITLSKRLARNTPADEFDVRQLKKALNRLGYYQPLATTGITGIPDAALFTALKSFQRDQGLRPDGVVTPDSVTIQKLNSEVSKAPEGQYIWRTTGDNRVREEHAQLNKSIRRWNDAPDPGEDFNCRCWAQPIAAITHSCAAEKEDFEKKHEKVKTLSNKLNDLLLQLQAQIEAHNTLVQNARKVLGGRAVAFIIGLPLNRLGILGELLQRFFENAISDKLIETAKIFMQQQSAARQKIQYTREQFALIFSELEKAGSDLELARKILEACERNEKISE